MVAIDHSEYSGEKIVGRQLEYLNIKNEEKRHQIELEEQKRI